MNIPAAQRTIQTIRTLLYAVVQEEVRQFQQPETLLRLHSNVKLMEIQAHIVNPSAAMQDGEGPSMATKPKQQRPDKNTWGEAKGLYSNDLKDCTVTSGCLYMRVMCLCACKHGIKCYLSPLRLPMMFKQPWLGSPPHNSLALSVSIIPPSVILSLQSTG